MKKESASDLIDERIKELGDWRGKTLAKVREILHKADPEIVEEWKWRGVQSDRREIPNELARTTGEVHIVCVLPIIQRIWVPFVDDLAMLASKSDLIVVGKAGTSTTHMNDHKGFLYSDWTFTVEEVLKDDPAASV